MVIFCKLSKNCLPALACKDTPLSSPPQCCLMLIVMFSSIIHLMVIFKLIMYVLCWSVLVFFPHVDIKLFKRFSFPHWNISVPLSKINCSWKCKTISGFTVLLLWQYYTVLIIIEWVLNLGSISFLSLFFIFKIDWGFFGPFYFHINFRSILSMSTCKKKKSGGIFIWIGFKL